MCVTKSISHLGFARANKAHLANYVEIILHSSDEPLLIAVTIEDIFFSSSFQKGQIMFGACYLRLAEQCQDSHKSINV